VQSSQWNGLRQFSALFPALDGGTDTAGPEPRLYYGGVSVAEITYRSSDRIGMQHWAQEGNCGRTVLLDYASYAERHGATHSCFIDHSIPLHILLDVAKEQNALQFRRETSILSVWA
jgi:hypothetical protein